MLHCYRRNVFLDNSDDRVENLDELRNQSGILYSHSEIQPTLRRRNILRQRPRTLTNPTMEVTAFKLFHSSDILLLIMRETNRKVSDVNRQNHLKISQFTENEISASLAILLRAGVDRDNYTVLDQLWNPTDSRPFYRAAMGIARFKQFLRCIRFDNIYSRTERRKTDCLAAISDIWNMFLSQIRQHYVPDADITVDEQLLGYRGRVPGRTYMPSKPKKYGVKIFWSCEAKTGFALNGKIYTGRQQNREPERELGKKIVLNLLQPFYKSGRNVVTDNFFTSHSLAVELIKQDLTLLGTLRRHRREIPLYLKNTRPLPPFSSRFTFDHENAITLVTYVPRRYRSVLLLSSSHSSAEVDVRNEKRKPKMILDYNKTKGGVDSFDENIEEFTCRRKTARWPLLLYYNILDASAFNAFLLMRTNGYRKSRPAFIRNLTLQLATPHILHRITLQRTSRDAKQCAIMIGVSSPFIATVPSMVTTNARRCHECSRNSRSRCDSCGKFCCPTHRFLFKNTKCTSCVL